MAKKSSSAASAEKNYVRCRYCGQKNTVRDDYVNGEAKCGRCKLSLSNEPHIKFAHLNKHDYVHPADSKALAALRAIPGIDTALKQLLKVTGESAIRVTFMASAVKVTPLQCPDLHAKLQVVCTTLGVDMPDLFIQQNPIVNAFTGGVDKPVIVLHSGLLERLDDEETLAVIAHEVGHIHAEHVLYLTAAQLILALATIPLGSLADCRNYQGNFDGFDARRTARVDATRRTFLRPRRSARHAKPAYYRHFDDETGGRHIRF